MPIAPGDLNYGEAAIGAPRPPRKPTRQAQPEGSNVRLDGHTLAWGSWRFHVRLDPRVGTVISQANWQDGGCACSSAAWASRSGAIGKP